MDDQKNKEQAVLGELLGKISALVAIITTLLLIILVLIVASFDISEGAIGLKGLKNSSTFFIQILTAMLLVIWGGIYGGKSAQKNPRKSGWIMFICGIISLVDTQFPAGVLLIVAGIYTIFFQKPSIELPQNK